MPNLFVSGDIEDRSDRLEVLKDMVATSLNEKYAINKWIFFTFNYPYDFIERCWSDAPILAEHIRGKFNDYGGDMNRLYCELDKSNGNKLLEWVMDNYDSERKLFG